MSGELLVVVPVIGVKTAEVCLSSVLRSDSSLGIPREQVLLIDNSKEGWVPDLLKVIGGEGLRQHRDPDDHNLGVARSWNVGAQTVLDEGQEYLVILSTSVEFGPALHTTWREQMDRFWGENVIECDGHSWHLIAFHRRVFERIGLFDGNFYPGYVEALDFSLRMRHVGWEGGWRRAWVNAVSRTIAGHLSQVSCPWRPLGEYYARKWGGEKGSETFTLPFGTQPLDWWDDIPIPELAAKYGLEVWW